MHIGDKLCKTLLNSSFHIHQHEIFNHWTRQTEPNLCLFWFAWLIESWQSQPFNLYLRNLSWMRLSTLNSTDHSSLKNNPKILFYYRFWFTSIMFRRNVLNQATIIILVTLLLLVVIGATKSTKKTRHCLKNCHKCKRHYGDLFVSHLCARTCIKHEGTYVDFFKAIYVSIKVVGKVMN